MEFYPAHFSMTTFASHIPTYRRIFRAIFNWRNARRALLAVAMLATLIVSFYLEELWRGEHDWADAKSAFEAQGGTLDPQKLAPPPVPDEENFAMTPLLNPPQGTPVPPNKWGRLAWPVAAGQDPDDSDFSWNTSSYGNWPLGKRQDLEDWKKFLGQTDILQALKKLDPELSEISTASRRPFARFPLEYGKDSFALFPNMGMLMHLAKIYTVRAQAELAAGQTDRAAEDTLTIFQLANSLTNEPFSFFQIMTVSLASSGLQVLWEGLVAHRWSESQLVEFSGGLQKFDYLAGEQLGLQGEIAQSDFLYQRSLSDSAYLKTLFQPWFQALGVGDTAKTPILLILKYELHQEAWMPYLAAELFPRGWLYQNRMVHLQDEQKFLATLDVSRHSVDVEKSKLIDVQLVQRKSTPYNFIANVYNFPNLNRVFAHFEASMDEAQVACALERFRLANGQWPETLAELMPKFIAKIPTDIISGGPMHYQKKPDGHFLLYEVGWNGTDDGGVIAKSSDGELDQKNGDWVWPDAVQP
jgi:hypothetical protein